MKNKLFKIGLWIGILCLVISYVPSTYANEDIPVRLKILDGYDNLELLETEDRVYITAYDQMVFEGELTYQISRQIYRFDALYEIFIVEDANSGDILYSKTGRSQIVFDTMYIEYDEPIYIKSGEETFELDTSESFMMYFVKEKEFSKLNDNLTLIVNVENPLEISELVSLFGAWDNYSGNITDSIKVIEDDYTANMDITGFYNVTIEATDESLNKSRYTYTVWVRDNVAPVVEPLEDITISYTDTFDIETILDKVVATDNYATELDIAIYDENYTGNESKVGSYFVEIQVDDYNGNAIKVMQNIHVVDDVAPVITGKTFHYFEVENIIRPNDLVNGLSAVDDIDEGPIKVYLISTNYERYVVGEFTAILGAKDSSGNEATITVTIQVNDSKKPVFFIKIPRINVVENQIYEADALLSMVEELLTINYTDIKIIENEYEGNENRPGVYLLKLSANTGTEWIEIQTQIRVNENMEKYLEPTNDKIHSNWLIISISLTSVVIVSVGLIYMIKRKKKSLRLK